MPRESTRRRSDLPSPPSTPAGANGPSPALRADVGTSFVLCWSVCRAGPEGPSPCTRFSGLRQAACHHATLHKTRAVIVCATTEVMSSPMSGRTRGTSLLRRAHAAPRVNPSSDDQIRRPAPRSPAPCLPSLRVARVRRVPDLERVVPLRSRPTSALPPREARSMPGWLRPSTARASDVLRPPPCLRTPRPEGWGEPLQGVLGSGSSCRRPIGRRPLPCSPRTVPLLLRPQGSAAAVDTPRVAGLTSRGAPHPGRVAVPGGGWP